MSKKTAGRRGVVACGSIAALCLFAGGHAMAQTRSYPTYTANSTNTLNGNLTGDIVGSAFVDLDGTFHWTTAFTSYNATDDGTAWERAFQNSDFGALTGNYGTTTLTQADAFYGTSGTLCNNLSSRANNPVASPYGDDHCDLVGMWVDPSDGTWYGIANDEYDFNPFNTTQTVTQRVSSGIHSNRILAVESTDKGASWSVIDEIITSPYQHNDAADNTAFPDGLWSYGVAGCRLFVDNSTGYFYVVYNNSIKVKPNYSTFVSWAAIARAPISGKMARGSWNKYYNHTWTQPGIGGLDGNVDDPLGLVASFVPSTDSFSLAGTGADGSSLNIQAKWVPSNGAFAFNDASGNAYTANVSTGTIANASGSSVPSVSYQDPATNSTFTVAVASGKIQFTQTDSTGRTVTNTPGIGYPVFRDATTNRLYITPQNRIQESAISYNTYSGSYRFVGYDRNVYEEADLGNPIGVGIVGALPSTASTGSYLTTLDVGSLTNQNVTGYSFRLISDNPGKFWDLTTAAPGSGQTNYSAAATYYDANGNPLTTTGTYMISAGGITISASGANNSSGANRWYLEPVADDYNSGVAGGFYRIKNVWNGNYLDASGSTVAARRAVGAPIHVDPIQGGFVASANGGAGSPGGSDQWYLLPVANDTPATLSPTSTTAVIAAATNTSLQGVKRYKIVNRNSGLVLEVVVGSGWRLAAPSFTDSAQIATLTPTY
ncbi:RICIN domain-containing protein [Rhodanobacter sp. PCA2]|uniref:RICIN domain-containing protein n=1 Tax=Rhodanobacter sp. PCA2 TaxID=2006117 RepID=UPI0015E75508|nr:RICIN domain-containing protein [Rhodanobacter sp. PCA2]